jgi:hypothetical protein
MLDMAFQLLAFFILTFRFPSSETDLSLTLRASPMDLSTASDGITPRSWARRVNTDLEEELVVRADADELGNLKALRLGEAIVPDLTSLGDRLFRYMQLLEHQPLRIRIAADDHLRFEPVTQIIATCYAVGISAIRLPRPGASTYAPVGRERPANTLKTRVRARPAEPKWTPIVKSTWRR